MNPSTNRLTIYTRESAMRNPIRMARAMLADLWAARELAAQLALRDIRAQYRQTALGIFWAFVLPIANAGAWIFIQRAGVVSVRDTGVSYPIYALTGTILWAVFMDALNGPLQQTMAAKPMLAKIKFPREALLISSFYQVAVNAAIKCGVLLAALPILGATLNWPLLLLPLVVVSLIVAGTAIGLAVTPIGMLYGDVGRGIPLVMQFMMYLTPVVFPPPTSGWPVTVFALNPLTSLFVTSHEIFAGRLPDLTSFLFVSVGMLLLLIMMWVVYRISMPILIERMSA